jgi:hypothetical protein
MALILRVSITVAVSVCLAHAQSDKRLTARELFYTPIADVKPPSASVKPSASKPAALASKPQSRPSKTPSDPVDNRQAASTPTGTVLQRVSNSADVVGPPLALRYSLLKQNSDGDYIEVDPETFFRSGDRIKVSVEANDMAHLYIVQQGSSKAWNVLFPNDSTGDGDNGVERSRPVTIPAGGRFTFDEQAGTERLFIVLSRQPEPDLEKLIYDLSRKNAAPASAPVENTRPKMMLAQTRVDDSVVNRLRGQMIARDLVFEKVDDDKPAPGGKREKAMYYGTQDRSSRARIVVDLNLRHQ